MNPLVQLADRLPSPWLLLAVVMAVWACFAAPWLYVFVRLRRRLPVIPFQPRRGVPWGGPETAASFAVYVLVPTCLVLVSQGWLDLEDAEPLADGQQARLDVQHPIARLLLEGQNVWVVVLSVVTALVIAPVVEEFLFRIVLQGWLEKLENLSLRRLPGFRRTIRGAFAVVVSSLLFAAVHFRVPAPAKSLDWLSYQMAVQAAAGLLTLVVCVGLLRFGARATWEDLGVVPAKLWADTKLGLTAFLAVTPLVYVLQILLTVTLRADIVTDPIPLFFLAMVFGTLCYRTHRVAPAIVMHATFNAVAVALALTAG